MAYLHAPIKTKNFLGKVASRKGVLPARARKALRKKKALGERLRKEVMSGETSPEDTMPSVAAVTKFFNPSVESRLLVLDGRMICLLGLQSKPSLAPWRSPPG
jgi:hypothetical protein